MHAYCLFVPGSLPYSKYHHIVYSFEKVPSRVAMAGMSDDERDRVPMAGMSDDPRDAQRDDHFSHFSSPSAKERFHVFASEQRKRSHTINMVAGAPRVASTTSRTTRRALALATPEQHRSADVPPKTKPFPHDQAVRSGRTWSTRGDVRFQWAPEWRGRVPCGSCGKWCWRRTGASYHVDRFGTFPLL